MTNSFQRIMFPFPEVKGGLQKMQNYWSLPKSLPANMEHTLTISTRKTFLLCKPGTMILRIVQRVSPFSRMAIPPGRILHDPTADPMAE